MLIQSSLKISIWSLDVRNLKTPDRIRRIELVYDQLRIPLQKKKSQLQFLHKFMANYADSFLISDVELFELEVWYYLKENLTMLLCNNEGFDSSKNNTKKVVCAIDSWGYLDTTGINCKHILNFFFFFKLLGFTLSLWGLNYIKIKICRRSSYEIKTYPFTCRGISFKGYIASPASPMPYELCKNQIDTTGKDENR